jgi:hypothetical protein
MAPMAPIIEEQELSFPGIQSRLMAMALKALQSYALVWAAAICGGVLWTFTVLNPTNLKIIACVGYAVTILVPVLWRDTRSA